MKGHQLRCIVSDIEKEYRRKSLDTNNTGYSEVVDYGKALVGYQDVSLR